MKPNIVFTKFSSNFNIKDPVSFTEKHGVIYRSVYATVNCNEDYVGECARMLYECIKDHKSCDHSPNLVKHAVETGHLPVATANIEVIKSGNCNNARGRKIAESLLVKKLKPTLNVQRKLVSLKFFN